MLKETQLRSPGLRLERCTLLPGGRCRGARYLSRPSDLLSPSPAPSDFQTSGGNDEEENLEISYLKGKGKGKRRNTEINTEIGCRAR